MPRNEERDALHCVPLSHIQTDNPFPRFGLLNNLSRCIYLPYPCMIGVPSPCPCAQITSPLPVRAVHFAYDQTRSSLRLSPCAIGVLSGVYCNKPRPHQSSSTKRKSGRIVLRPDLQCHPVPKDLSPCPCTQITSPMTMLTDYFAYDHAHRLLRL
jgi:hypothetical protein